MKSLPGGTITFLFTDIEGSTQLWERHPEAMRSALARHDYLLRSAIEGNNGRVIKTTGDGLHAVFASALDGLNAVLAGQRALSAESWPATGALRVRMALHTGEEEQRDGDYYGPTLNRAARLMAVATGGQSLVSQATADLIGERLPEAVSLRDLGEHRLKDLVHPEQVFQVIAPDLPDDFPPLKSLNAFPNNLPVQLTSFVGREAEIEEARRLLAETHLLTLTGPGGTGKTRLSLQIAGEALTDFSDGAWLVELAPLASPDFILPALAAVLGVRETGGRSLAQVVNDYLQAKTLLLLLDNCEHLIEACARLADNLLHGCPRLKIITSSREALGLAGEISYRVPSLALPDPGSATPEALGRSEAVQLFIARARAAQPHFSITGSNAPAIAAICTRLDGIPLAIELAAARVRVLSAEQIAARLDDRFRLLVGGSRTALPRQQTLQALIDWSYELLTKDERVLLRRLSVFAGGFSLEAAEAIGSGIGVLDLLAGLVNKSLVSVEEGDQAARYRLLETIRQYAREKLLEAGEAESVRDLHLNFYLRLTEAAEPKLTSAEMIPTLDQLEVEQENLRTALEWALENDPLTALRLVVNLYSFWGRRKSISEGLQWIKTSLAMAEAVAPQEGEAALVYLANRAKALVGVGTLAFAFGNIQEARPAIEASAALARQIGAARTLANALGIGAMVMTALGDWSTALVWSDEAIAISRQNGYSYELGVYSVYHLFKAFVTGQPVSTDAEEEMLRSARASGNPWVIAVSVQNTARLAVISGDLEKALAGFKEAADLYLLMRDRSFYNSSRSDIAHVLRKQGRIAEAVQVYGETIRVFQESGQHAAVAHELECFAFIAQATGQVERAARLLGTAEALRESISSSMMPTERMEYDQVMAQLRAGMDEAALKATWADGRGLTVERAIEIALAVEAALES